jgi:hypothetical protein
MKTRRTPACAAFSMKFGMRWHKMSTCIVKPIRAPVWRIVFMIGTKALFDGKLERDAARERDRILGEMIDEFEEHRART